MSSTNYQANVHNAFNNFAFMFIFVKELSDVTVFIMMLGYEFSLAAFGRILNIRGTDFDRSTGLLMVYRLAKIAFRACIIRCAMNMSDC